MSFLIDELCRLRSHQLPQPMILYHYCQNDETGHALYIFSSLILSLLEQCIGLKKEFFDWYRRDLLAGNFEPSTNIQKLKDILDQLDSVPRIDVGADPERDRIIAEKIVETKLAPLAADAKKLVVERLSNCAQGSAIWTKLTVEVIAAHKIRALGRIKRFLENMAQPRKLSELYATLFLRCAGEEPEAQNMAATALEILGAARRRLSILELAWAVAMSTADPDVTSVAEIAELVDDQGVMALIQPFVGGVDFNDLKKRQVIVVHQSAREFIVNELALIRSGPQNAERSPAIRGETIAPFTQSKLENTIFNVCVRYLLLDEIGNIPLFSDEQIAINELPQSLDLFSDDNDTTAYTADCSWEMDRGLGELFVYASCHWITHFRSIVAEPLPDLKSIERVCQANSTRLHNWTSQNCRPDCLLLKMLEVSDFESSAFLCGTALLAVDQVLQWGDLCRLRLLFFGHGTKRHLQNLDFFRRIIDAWRFSNQDRCQDWDDAFSIVNDIPDILIAEGWGNELFCLVASQGCLPVIKRLMEIAQHNTDLRKELLREPQRQPRSLANRIHQSIGEAVLAGHVGVVEYLLQQDGIEAHLHHRNTNGENVLHLASVQCDPAMFRILVPKFLDGLSQKDWRGRTALMRVVENLSTLQGRMESAKIIISLGMTHGTARLTENQQEALHMAERMRDEAMCNLLTRLS
ncbi:ankyrin repeat protein [Colletotrichum limetticola]|uniref:Ankyrin repeat protein n=1 Tax=Colletotrichum limetticola TaxID=1209924 RepID=A0ABQ9PE76_9PEZI|nr:ankyrin repeat protein [Colletotrichum limetticola]